VRTLQPLLDRDQYSQAEWDLVSDGRCPWFTGMPDGPDYPGGYCGTPSDPGSRDRFCAIHDRVVSRYAVDLFPSSR
jgi:hypothetical protein